MHSWSGSRHTSSASSFNPYCRVHGRRALLEAYACDKFIKASEELRLALDSEQRRAVERYNTRWRRLLRQSFIYTRHDYSIYLFSPKNNLRINCLNLVQLKCFDYVILFFIGINCITLAMERPSIPPASIERVFLTTSGYIFTIIFAIEMSLKVIAHGCVIGPNAYFKDGWNILDGILVIVSLVNILFDLFASGQRKLTNYLSTTGVYFCLKKKLY
jgi:hypothetical protein